jgi:magnesium transporter
VIVDCAVYEHGRRRPERLDVADAYDAGSAPGAFVWIGLHEPTEEEFAKVRWEFDLHELAVEDAINAHQRPKLEVYGDSLFLVLKTVRYVAERDEVEFGEIQLFVGEHFLVSVRHGQATDLHPVRLEAERRADLLACGPGTIVHAIADRVVDDYGPVLEALEQDIQHVEALVFSPRGEAAAERIYYLKREVLDFHRAVAPLAEPLHRLSRGHYELIHEDVRAYFRDVYDHALRAVAQLETFRDLLTSILAAHLSQISIRQNEDMRRISAWVAIVAVPTMIAGIYGMNFRHMPELGWTFGYPLAVAVMALICTALYRYFRRIGWL